MLRRAYYSMRRDLAARLAHLEVTAEQYSVLYVLDEPKGLRQQTIADRLFSDANTIGAVIKRLEEKGWIERAPDPSDRRAMLVRMTVKGTEVRNIALSHGDEIKAIASQDFSEDDMKALYDLLERLYLNVMKGPP